MSTLKVDTIQDTNAVEMYLCKAWVNFDGTGTVAIRESGNVSSITDNGTGNYTVNLTTAMPDTNYSSVITGAYSSDGNVIAYNYPTAQTVSTVTVRGRNLYASNASDADFIHCAIFR